MCSCPKLRIDLHHMIKFPHHTTVHSLAFAVVSWHQRTECGQVHAVVGLGTRPHVPVVHRSPPSRDGRKNGGWLRTMLTTRPTSHIPMQRIHWKNTPACTEQRNQLSRAHLLQVLGHLRTISCVKLLDGDEVASKE